MLLQKLLPEFKGLVWRSNDLDLILMIKYSLDSPAILLGVDALESANN
jgi:hypothetical protein